MMDFDPENYRQLLSIADENGLQLADSRVRTANSTERSSHLLREIDPHSQLVAYYRVWIHLSGKPPFKEQRGWEKYAPDGRLLDREVRYSQQPSGAVLH